MGRSAARGVRPAYAAVRRKGSVRHTPQAAERRASGTRRRPPRGGRPAYAEVRKEVSARHAPQSVKRGAFGIHRS